MINSTSGTSGKGKFKVKVFIIYTTSEPNQEKKWDLPMSSYNLEHYIKWQDATW